jgi:hypothetical protein
MICDGCDFKVCHSYCAGFGNEIPDGDWFCIFCLEEAEMLSDSEY